MVNLCAKRISHVICMEIYAKYRMLISFSLKFKHLICLIEKFSLSLHGYIDNSF